ncbi:MAG TPA: hypothetical protein VF721_23270 [Pyrinomonadaceae bacterium]|jgi:hypothetical protein
MKNRATILCSILFVLGILPLFQKALAGETEIIIDVRSYTGDNYRLYGNSTREFRHFVNQSHLDIVIIGAGGAILICI